MEGALVRPRPAGVAVAAAPARGARGAATPSRTRRSASRCSLDLVRGRRRGRPRRPPRAPTCSGPDWDPDGRRPPLRADPDRGGRRGAARPAEPGRDRQRLPSELCFIGGRRPAPRVGDVPDLPRLVARRPRCCGPTGTAPSGSPPETGDRAEQLWVYGRRSRACAAAPPIEVGDLGPEGQERTVWWCPSCQPART